MIMIKKNRTIEKPDLPERLETLAINGLENRSSYEMGRLESTIGPVCAELVRFNEIHVKGVNFEETHKLQNFHHPSLVLYYLHYKNIRSF